MTSISTDELKKVGRRLFESNIIDEQAFLIFIAGDGASDANGRQTNTHVKFNAIALFDEKLQDYLAFVDSNPDVRRSQGIPEYIQGMVDANRAINALLYFAHSPKDDLSVEEHA